MARKPLWLDEYGYQTNPPDHGVGVLLPSRRVRDAVDRTRGGEPACRRCCSGSSCATSRGSPDWQSGLETVAGIRKPAFAAFARAALDPQ